MNPEENHELLDKLSEKLERDVRRYPQEFKEDQSLVWKGGRCVLANSYGIGIQRHYRLHTNGTSSV